VILSITLLAAFAVFASSGDKPFQAGPANVYAHQSSGEVTVGAKSYDSEQLTAEAFGKKTDLLKYGVLPVLVVIENKRAKALDLRDIEVSLVATDGRHATPVSPEDLPFLASHAKPPSVKPYPPIPLPKKKNPLNTPELVIRAFAAKMVPPGDSASGFFYFEAHPEAGDKIYLNGVRDARTQEEIIYFEFPLAK
jgi:hypothetical protein